MRLAFQGITDLDLLTKLGSFAIFIAVTGGALWYGIRKGRSEAEEERIHPFKEAADGWERVAKQQEAELKQVCAQLAAVQKEYDELKQDYDTAMRLNMRLQGAVDQLTSRVSALEQVITIMKERGSA